MPRGGLWGQITKAPDHERMLVDTHNDTHIDMHNPCVGLLHVLR
jgi:hypothetical protein